MLLVMEEKAMIGKGVRIYSIIGENGRYMVVGGLRLKGNKKLVDEIAEVPASNIEEVKEIIMRGEIKKYSILGK
ncbi:hypothetical protein PHRODO_232 [Bacillus phage Phrodo]|uniref:hypothetical protein n=1 Tax=Bacillus phage Phrodo TaxID=1805953 RepID=UPI0007A769E7|nr:hypothetical protein BI003_gp232 [Bacillus phage Phrodo]AMW62273.1 hypothetical protein PHRODO_232 [Bacillus phage Phrodo]UGO49042.1 hypothetical protein JARJAR_228 [Bacillus phage vB_BanH_JarJar]UGO50532.1 hypothetical protein RONSWANSON_226 [Bacillus phage vB_BanH_RonSwanson]